MAPWPAPSSARRVAPAGQARRREPDHVIGHRHELDGNGHRAMVGGHGHLIAVGQAGFGRGRRGHPGHHRAGGARQRRLAVLHAPAVQQLVPAGQPDVQAIRRIVADRRHAGPGGRRRRRLRTRAAPGTERGELRARRRGVGQPQVDVHLIGDRAEHVQVGADLRNPQRRAERAAATFPVHERPGLLGHGGDREHHVGAVGDRAGPQLEADHEGRRLDRPQRRLRIGQVGRVHPGHHQGAELAVGRGGEHGRGVASQRAGQRALAPGPGHLGAGRGVGHPAADGQQAGQGARLDRAPLARAARHPGQPGARREREPGRGRERARHGGQPLADQDHRAGLAERLARIFPALVRGLRASRLPARGAGRVARGQRGQRGGLVAGQGGQQGAGQLGQPGAGQRRDGEHRQLAVAHRLAQPQEDDRRLVFRLEPGQQHGRCLFQVGVADRDVAPGHAGREELLLLGRVRARPHVHVVGVQGDPGELGVRVGVLEGEPPAGQHAGPARPLGVRVARRGQAGRGHRQRVRPGRRDEHPVGVPDQRGGEPVGLRRVGEGPAALVAVPLLVDQAAPRPPAGA